jgi:FkbM family methyltransferase
MDETLLLMHQRGYRPKVIVDGGANKGIWTQMVHPLFPTAEIHLIEPQPACAPILEKLVQQVPGLVFHPIAVTAPGIMQVRMVGGGEQGGGTGARVARLGETEHHEITCPATTLDALLADRVAPGERLLLKLDMEGHERAALQGGSRLLQMAEVVLTEVGFYDINNTGRPKFSEILNFLSTHSFELYDIACLAPRPRDQRLRLGDVVFVHSKSPLLDDRSWE